LLAYDDVVRFMFELDIFRTRAFYYYSQIVRSIRAVNSVI